MTLIRLLFCSTIVLSLLFGCSGGDSSSGAPSTLIIASVAVAGGDGQTAAAGSELPNPIVAKILDSEGQPVSGQLVNFVVISGGGTVSSGAVTSDSNGNVITRWTLGTVAGTQAVDVQLPDESGTAVTYATFRAVAYAGTPQTVNILSGDMQTGVQLQPLPLPVTVEVKDSYGNVVPGIMVTFAASDGSVSPTSAITDTSGKAAAVWTLGTASAETLTASVSGLAAVTFTSTATIPPTTPTTVTKVSGDQQTVTQHFWLKQPLVVSVADTLGRPVVGHQVVFTTTTGLGSNSPQTVTTDANGYASWSGSFHDTGQQSVEAAPAGLNSVTFTATVSPNSHIYDGVWLCNYFKMGIAHGQLLLPGLLPGIPVPVYPPPPIPTAYDVSGTIRESDGYFEGTMRRSMNSYYTFAGYLTVDSSGRGTGAGTTVEAVLLSPILYVNHSDWSCVRQ